MATSGQAEDLKKGLSEQVGAQAQQAKDLKRALLEQTLLVQEQKEQAQAQADALQEEIEVQGKTLSAFTVVNVLFLPLGFFTSASTPSPAFLFYY